MNSESKQDDHQDIDYTNHKELVKLTARTFFQDAEIIVLDHLNSLPFPAITNHDLRNVLHVKDRDIHRICSRLVDRRLIRREHRQKEKGVRPPPPGSTTTPIANIGTGGGDIYVLDYKLFVNVLSLLLVELTQRIERSINHAIDTRGYMCPVCSRQYPLQEAFEQQVPTILQSGEQSFMFVCAAHPTAELIEDQSLLADEPPELKLLNMQLRPLLHLVELCRDIPLPEYNRIMTLQIIRQQQIQARLERDALRAIQLSANPWNNSTDPGAGDHSDDSSGAGSASNFIIEFVDHAAGIDQQLKDAQVFNNKLPEWHRVSTVTGESMSAMSPALDRIEATAAGNPLKDLAVDGHSEEYTNEDQQYVANYLSRMLSESKNFLKRTLPMTTDTHGERSKKRARPGDGSNLTNGLELYSCSDTEKMLFDEDPDEEEDVFEDVVVSHSTSFSSTPGIMN